MARYKDRIGSSIAGFDRILFRGSLRSICHRDSRDKFLGSQGVLYKDLGAFAQRLSTAVKERAEQIAREAGRPFLYVPSGEQSKQDIARSVVQRDSISEGLVCVWSCVEPCRSFGISRDRAGKRLRLKAEQRKCLHRYCYFPDREFGLLHIRLQSWLPLTMQVCANGREWLARQMDPEKIASEKKDNCFTRIAHPARAQVLLDRLVKRRWAPWLDAWARLVNPWIAGKNRLDLRPYYGTMREGEYAIDVMFRDAPSWAEIYPALCRHAIEPFRSPQVLRFLARRTNLRFNGAVRTTVQQRPEGVCVKHGAEENSIKMYDKPGSVLRIETTINHPRRFRVRRRVTRHGQAVMGWVPLRKGIADLGRRVQLSHAAHERYREALAVVGEPQPSHRIPDPVSRPVETTRRFRALRPTSPQDSSLFGILLRGEFQLQGVRNQDWRQHLYPETAADPVQRRSLAARITRHLRLLPAHGLIYRVAKTYYYRITKKGHEVMSTALRFRETNRALLAA